MGSSKKIEKIIKNYTNNSRKKHDLIKISYDNRLSKIAQSHSKSMAKNGKIWHGDGVHLAGGFAGENVAMVPKGGSSKDVARRFHNCWINSPGHRANILRKEFGIIGVGVIKKGGYYYGTQLFKKENDLSEINIYLNKRIKKKLLSLIFRWLIFLLGISLSLFISYFINFSDILFLSLLSGFIIEIINSSYDKLKKHSNFIINKSFFLWILVYSLIYLLFYFFLNFNLFLLSFTFLIIRMIIKKIKFYKKNVWTTIFILLFLLLFIFISK